MLVIPGSATASVVGESRRFKGCDTGFTPGVLVYLIDATMPTRQGALWVLPIHDVDAWKRWASLTTGKALTCQGVTVTVVGSDGPGDVVRVVR